MLKKNDKNISNIKKIVYIAMASAIAGVLMFFDFPLPIAPAFIKMDVSEFPAIFIGFAFGPIEGVITIIIKNLIKLILKPTTTAFVGELMNVILGSVYVIIASLIYKFSHTKKGAMVSLVISIMITSILATILNASVMFPLYARLYGMPLDKIIEMGVKINPIVKDYTTLMIFCILPFNLIKYFVISFLIFLTYKTFKKIKI